MIGHRSGAMEQILKGMAPRLAALARTARPVLVGTTSATGFMEMAVRNGVRRRALSLVNGAFSERFANLVTAAGKAGMANPGIHGFSEVLYAFSSASNNNGSAFAGLSANTPFYNTALGLCMLFGRYWLAIPVLAIAGSLARKKTVPAGPGTLPTATPLFVGLLVGVVILVGALTFVPALALGPIVEHLTLIAAK